jgi:hypothetical protein
MQRHRFDPVSAVLGVLAVALGILVLTGELDSFDTEGAWWLALAAIVIGLAIIPWRRGTPEEPLDEPLDEEPAVLED